MTVYNKPITLSDVSRITGVGSKKLGRMIAYGNYNENSLHKPIRCHNCFSPVTEEQRKAANYGWYIPLYSSFAAMRTALANGETFVYQKPRGLNYVENGQTYNEPYRAQDFNGFDSAATSPFQLNIETSASIGGSIRFSLPIRLTELLTWAEWSDYTGFNDLYVGIYVPDVGYYPISYYKSAYQIGNRGDELLSIPIASGEFTAEQTYDCYIVLTTWGPTLQQWYTNPSSNEGADGKRWYVIVAKDTTPPSFTVAPAYNPTSGIIFGYSNAVTSYRLDRETGLYTYSNTSFDYSIVMENYSGDLMPSVSIDFVVRGVYPGTGTTTVDKKIGYLSSTSFTQGTTITGSISYPDDIRFLTDKQLEVEARITLSLKTANAGSQIYSKTEYISPELQ